MEYERFYHCAFCKADMPRFAITPLLRDEDGNLHSCCKPCADKNLPGWEKEEDKYERAVRKHIEKASKAK